MRVASGFWLVMGSFFVLAFVATLLNDAEPTVLFMSAALAAATGWLGLRLWRNPSRTDAIISACMGGFFLFLGVVAVLQGALGSTPWGIAIPLAAAAAALLPLRSWSEIT